MGRKQRKIKNKNKSKKIRIPRNSDIEEIVEQVEENKKIENMEQVIAKMDEKRKKFKKSLEVYNETVNVDIDNKKIERKVKNFSDRRNAQIRDYERRLVYLKAMNKLEEINDENETEIQQFFDDVQRKTDEYLRKQDEEEKLRQTEKYNIKSKNKKKKGKRLSGALMQEIFSSEER